MSVRRARHNLWTRVPLKRNWKQGGLALYHIARRETRAGVAHIILVVCHCCGGKLEQPIGCGRLGRWCANWAKVADRGWRAKAQRGRRGAVARESVRVVEQLVDVRWPPRWLMRRPVSARDANPPPKVVAAR